MPVFLPKGRRQIATKMLGLGTMRYAGLVLVACAFVSGCASSEPRLLTMVDINKRVFKTGSDPDIVPTSLRPQLKTELPKLPKRVDRPDLGLKLKNSYARLQFRLPLLSRNVPMQLTAVARSYWEPESIASPRGKFLLQLSLPLPFKRSRTEKRTAPLSTGLIED